MMIRTLSTVVIAILLAGCTSTASRMAECEAQGVSKDTCYLAEQNRQTAIYAAAEKQALENAAKQYAQSAKSKTLQARIAGIDIKISPDIKQGYIEQTAAALTEENQYAQVYQKGVYTAIWYRQKHKIVLLRDGQIVGSAKG
ncbi:MULTISPECIES: hypothetical protein [Serratia]|jgi:uncharacterized protein YceK|uniref:Lipoprotein n=1 Tax=Serratia fonticola TaxID=47917 RepID=A0A0F7HDM7_SERFO|nr:MULTISPECIES: hypothetical protein [Serratia]AKG70238.1 hypothetical protein WN53_14610 [Serratia fonticola]MBC3230248.1 hypothetical protein [Serratia fonticola]MCO7510670.1 hypothetical protein [Serratia fonticola]OCJ22570.1 hypothetical protein A6U95_12295 [Serratia sp. 14-2641]QKJ60194.1 hypothetical protein G9399_20160 [Serratia fonticola]